MFYKHLIRAYYFKFPHFSKMYFHCALKYATISSQALAIITVDKLLIYKSDYE